MTALEVAVQAPVRDLEASAPVIGAPLAWRVVIHSVATALAGAVVLALPFPTPQIGVAATVSGLAIVGLLVFTLLKGRHDSAPALHG